MAGSTASPTFHPFPRLPRELQLKIWKSAAAKPEPRDIKVQIVLKPTKTPDKYKGYLKALTPPPPPLLHACRNSRIVGLQVYTTKAFDVCDDDGHKEKAIYAIPNLDNIHVDMPNLSHFAFSKTYYHPQFCSLGETKLIEYGS
ncbi:hypothetical protein BDZ45DRAFT_777130 [Acephala macrosclerotiorum]|nr:hypothetical protein BDZ45DRAFT_777130 [Acephala macrosclerotiorum]